MRCPNCGWENQDGSSSCEKCGTTLTSQGSAQKSFNHSTVRENDPFKVSSPINSTVRENDPFKKSIDDPYGETVKDRIKHETKDTGKTGRSLNTGGGTINPWASASKVSRCKLTPVAISGEDPRYIPGEILLKGNSHQLNRENLDPDNNTITSKVQATLSCNDGKWTIQDQSSQQTTYIHAGEPKEIKSGDIILMGNRMFIFNED